jgi:hypothetical protein
MIRFASGALVGAAVLATAACSDSTGPVGGGGSEEVAVRMAAVEPSGAGTSVEGETLVLTGTNGTLRIDALYAIMDEFELKRVDDDFCPGGDDDECEEFEAGPEFLNIPLDGEGVIAVQQAVDTGTYHRLEFEIEDLEDDEEDPARAARTVALRNEIRAQFPEWPSDASMLVVGSFTPTGGVETQFRVYIEAEIEVEMALVPPVVIDASASNPSFTVRLDPALMFRNGTTVRNLALLDFAATGSVVEFEIEIENGITEVEYDD